MDCDVSIDCLGMKCPRPITEIFKKFRKMEIDQVIEMLSDDRVARHDVPAWCEKMRHQFLGREDCESFDKYYVRKAR
jgi:TusA-related sulfurtransferase